MLSFFIPTEPTVTSFISESETDHLDSSAMDKSAVGHLTDANESLKNELWDLRETAANLDLEKQDIIVENKFIKEQNRTLEAKMECFKGMVEEFRKEEEELQATLSQLEETLEPLEFQNKNLNGSNKSLREEIQAMSSHVAVFQDYKATQDKDILCMKQVMGHIVKHFKQLEAKIETAEKQYEEEKGQVSELKRTWDELEQIREVQENEIVCLRGQLEEAAVPRLETDESAKAPSLLHEMVQAKLVQDSLVMESTVLFLLSKITWIVMAALVCLGTLGVLFKLYVSVFNTDLETRRQLLQFSDRNFKLLLDVFAPHHMSKPNQLLPF